LPSRIEGTTNLSRMRRLTARPTRARKPLNLPVTRSKKAKAIPSQSIGARRSKSAKE
jgi:hypothetical protein